MIEEIQRIKEAKAHVEIGSFPVKRVTNNKTLQRTIWYLQNHNKETYKRPQKIAKELGWERSDKLTKLWKSSAIRAILVFFLSKTLQYWKTFDIDWHEERKKKNGNPVKTETLITLKAKQFCSVSQKQLVQHTCLRHPTQDIALGF